MPSGFVTLGQIATRLIIVDVACNRCDRRRLMRVDEFVAEQVSAHPRRRYVRSSLSTARHFSPFLFCYDAAGWE